jgi:hypothetical protein
MALLETLDVLREAVKVFRENDDLRTVSEIKMIQEQQKTEFEAFQIDARKCIKGISFFIASLS